MNIQSRLLTIVAVGLGWMATWAAFMALLVTAPQRGVSLRMRSSTSPSFLISSP
jgi:hypothetical protein